MLLESEKFNPGDINPGPAQFHVKPQQSKTARQCPGGCNLIEAGNFYL
jgi:hypothetical protein